MDMLKLAGLKETIEKQVKCHDQIRITYIKLIESVYLDQYEKNNPQEDEVYLISFRLNKDEFLKSYKITSDPKIYREFLDIQGSHSFYKRKKYPELEVKRYNLKRIRENRGKK